jgi:hypothetical protein
MKPKKMQALFMSLSTYEKNCLEQSKKVFEQENNIQFTTMQAYVDHLAMAVVVKKMNGEFVPRHIDEARAGRYLF